VKNELSRRKANKTKTVCLRGGEAVKISNFTERETRKEAKGAEKRGVAEIGRGKSHYKEI